MLENESATQPAGDSGPGPVDTSQPAPENTVDLSPDANEPDEGQQEQQTDDKRPTRKERRGERFREAGEWKQQFEQMQQANERMMRRLDEIERGSQRRSDDGERETRRPAGRDFAGEERRLLEEMQHQQEIANNDKVSDAVAKRAVERYYEAQSKLFDLKIEKNDAGKTERAPQQQNQASAYLVAEFPWLLQGNNRDGAIATYNYLVHVKKRAPGLATEREACAQFAAENKLGTPPPASDRDRERNKGNTDGRTGGGKPTRITLNAEEWRMFEAQAPDGETREARGKRLTQFARSVGEFDPSRYHS